MLTVLGKLKIGRMMIMTIQRILMINGQMAKPSRRPLNTLAHPGSHGGQSCVFRVFFYKAPVTGRLRQTGYAAILAHAG
jgi:hypothetical protein